MTPSDPAISNETARRYLLGRLGLWPGRRWSGKSGTIETLSAIEALQLDPVQVVARSHDLVLWSRVDSYHPNLLDDVQFQDRAYFDYGGHLDLYPMSELRYWRHHMARRAAEPHRAIFAAEHAAVIGHVRDRIRDEGPAANRDIAGSTIERVYRGGKDTSLALYHLWLTGELMTHRRRGFERIYDLTERIVPPEHDIYATDEEARAFFATKALRQIGLGRVTDWRRSVRYARQQEQSGAEAKRWLDRLVEDGIAARVKVDSMREPWYLPANDLERLQTVAAGGVPIDWRPLSTTTDREAVLLSPLDNLLYRERTLQLFDFFYRWEIYVPQGKREWGAYTMPILYKTALVGRIDPKLDRLARRLTFNGLWLENPRLAKESEFVDALATGVARFADFHDAREIDLTEVGPKSLQTALRVRLRSYRLHGLRTRPAPMSTPDG